MGRPAILIADAVAHGERPGLHGVRNLAVVLMACSVALGCSSSKSVRPQAGGGIALIATDSLRVTEPSDVAINDAGTVLWTVSNNPDRVYQLDLHGNVTRTLNFVGEDLEGIAYDPVDTTLWVAEENRRELVHLDMNGDVLSRTLLGLTGERNNGLEGVCLNDQHQMFVVNEKSPGLFIELNADHAIASQMRLGFAGDYSGISFDRRNNGFWIVSDQSKELYLWNKVNGVMRQYALPFPKPEGVAFDESRQLIYVVSDATSKLYVFRLE